MAIYHKGERLDGGGSGGMTPYEYAVAGGYTGTEEEFLTLLKSGPYLPTSGGEVNGPLVFGLSEKLGFLYQNGFMDEPKTLHVRTGGNIPYSGIKGGVFWPAIEFDTNMSVKGNVGLNGNHLYYIADPKYDDEATNKRYVDTAIQTALSGAAGAKIATGSYVGNGKVGSANPTVIECGFSPKFVVCSNQGQGFTIKAVYSGNTTEFALYDSFIWFAGQRSIRLASSTTSSAYMQVTAGATYLSFYNGSTGASSVMQMNAPNNTYYWLAIG